MRQASSLTVPIELEGLGQQHDFSFTHAVETYDVTFVSDIVNDCHIIAVALGVVEDRSDDSLRNRICFIQGRDDTDRGMHDRKASVIPLVGYYVVTYGFAEGWQYQIGKVAKSIGIFLIQVNTQTDKRT